MGSVESDLSNYMAAQDRAERAMPNESERDEWMREWIDKELRTDNRQFAADYIIEAIADDCISLCRALADGDELELGNMIAKAVKRYMEPLAEKACDEYDWQQHRQDERDAEMEARV